ncbi:MULTISPECIES: cyclic peptide export ABC transporter [Pseudomonas]|nr:MULTISPECIES: cyclic peptide export ABC transporter [Pseudomonas]
MSMQTGILIVSRERASWLVFCVIAGLASSCAVILAIREIALVLADAGSGPAFSWRIFLIALAVSILGGLSSQLALGHLGVRLVHELRLHVAQRILQLPYREYEQQGFSRMYAMLSDDVTKASTALGTLPMCVVCIGLVVFGLGYLLLLSPWHFALVAVVLFLGIVIARYASARTSRALREVRALEDQMQDLYRAMIEGAKEFRFSTRRRRDFLASVLSPLSSRLASRKQASGALWSVTVQWNNLVFFLLLAVVAILPRHMPISDASTMTTYALVLLLLRAPIMALMELVPTVLAGKVALDRLAQLDVAHSASSAEEPSVTPSIRTLALRSVCFDYAAEPGEAGVRLGPIDLSLRSGKIIFITGGNGSGKTTLAKLLSGLYAPSEGSVLLDGVELKPDVTTVLRHYASAIFSDFFVLPYEGQRSNVAIDLASWEKRLGLDDKLSAASEWRSAPRLSQGQRKRLALLNLVAQDKPVCLFDEWAADQDKDYRDLFYRQLLRELAAKDKIVIVVSHDTDYFFVADIVIHMKDLKVTHIEEKDQ